MNREHRKKHIAVPAAAFSYPGRIRSLLAGSCPVFFSADGVIRENLVHLYFITDGYEPLKEKTFLSARQCLLLMKEIVMGCRTAADWLWNGEELVLSLQTVWVNESGTPKAFSPYSGIENSDGPDRKGISRRAAAYLFSETAALQNHHQSN